MKKIFGERPFITVGLAALLAGCGGGGSNGSSGNPSVLSADQAASEQFCLRRMLHITFTGSCHFQAPL